MATLKKNVSQVGFPGAGDLDECWLVATLTCLKNICPRLALPNARTFRDAAGVPDVQGRDNGGTGYDIGRAFRELYPGLPFAGYTFTWADFKDRMKPGVVASIAVMSSALPGGLQYGFGGGHRVAVELLPDDTWLFLNPLAKNGTRPQKISQADLRLAAAKFAGAGKIGAIVFTPDTVKEYFALNVYTRLNRTGSFVLPAGKSLKLFTWDNGGWRIKTKVAASSAERSGTFDYTLGRSAGFATPSQVAHVVSGPGTGYFISLAEVIEKFNTVPTYTKAQLDRAVAEAKADVKAAVNKALSSL